jgi:2-oxo-4-hydroxy-4-carboxy-5-ureidoimidazoline decarboxylase
VEAEDLFERSSPLARRVAETGGNPIAAAREAVRRMPETEKIATLNAHPRIGETRNLSDRSRREQGDEQDPAVLDELRRLNEEYERRFGFRFVVFVDGRPRSTILEVLRYRIAGDRAAEMETGLAAIIAIAEDRWRRR